MARPLLQQAAESEREAGRLGPLTNALAMASAAANMAGDRTSALRLLDEARDASADLDDVEALSSVLQARVFDGFLGGDLAAVASASAEGVSLSRRAGDLYRLDIWLMNLGIAALAAGRPDEARPLVAEALADRASDRRPGGAVPPARRIGVPRGRIRAGAAGGTAPRASGHHRRWCRRARHALPGAARGAGRVGRDRGAGAIPVRRRPPRRESPGPGRRRAPRARRIQRGHQRRPRARRHRPALQERRRGRAAGGGRADQQGDRGALVHIRAHRGQPRPRHPEQAGVRLARADRRLGGGERVAAPAASRRGDARAGRPRLRPGLGPAIGNRRPSRATDVGDSLPGHESRRCHGSPARPMLPSMVEELRIHRVEVSFVGTPPIGQVERASGVSDVAVEGSNLRCLVCGSFQPFLEALPWSRGRQPHLDADRSLCGRRSAACRGVTASSVVRAEGSRRATWRQEACHSGLSDVRYSIQ